MQGSDDTIFFRYIVSEKFEYRRKFFESIFIEKNSSIFFDFDIFRYIDIEKSKIPTSSNKHYTTINYRSKNFDKFSLNYLRRGKTNIYLQGRYKKRVPRSVPSTGHMKWVSRSGLPQGWAGTISKYLARIIGIVLVQDLRPSISPFSGFINTCFKKKYCSQCRRSSGACVLFLCGFQRTL